MLKLRRRPRAVSSLFLLPLLASAWAGQLDAGHDQCPYVQGAAYDPNQLTANAPINISHVLTSPTLWSSNGFSSSFSILSSAWSGGQADCCLECCARRNRTALCISAVYSSKYGSCGLLLKSVIRESWQSITAPGHWVFMSRCAAQLPPPNQPTANPPVWESSPPASDPPSVDPAPPMAAVSTPPPDVSPPVAKAAQSSKPAPAVTGSIAAAAAVLLLAVIAAGWRWFARSPCRHDAKQPGLTSVASEKDSDDSPADHFQPGQFSQSSCDRLAELGNTDVAHPASSKHSLSSIQYTLATIRSTSAGFGPNQTLASISEALAALQLQLDHLHQANLTLYDKYTVGGRTDRRVGGQGVVQFGTHIPTNQAVALKFFVDRVAFDTEEAYYTDPNLRGILPDVADIVRNDAESGGMTVLGRALPPVVVLEKGESLDEWQRRHQPDFASSMQIILHLVQRLRTLHSAGVVHRDLKPANCMMYPRRNEWLVIDFGSAGKVGEMVPYACTLSYAAPETILALARKDGLVLADPSVDVWALGVMAWELLTKTRVFCQKESTAKQVVETMLGRRQFPWEDEATLAREQSRLGFMREGILGMLARDAKARASLDSISQAWQAILQHDQS